ncbi:MAG TPA: sugar phosphate nucleotidyltransferase [Gemmatimonadaceae bacterium]|nr:sugar phosphate nucleotidyltransferase [Gemmatimonadaceae bacterium]
MTRWAVILAGGVGSRFWPLSTPHRPKQLLPLVGSRPLLVETAERLAPLVPPERTLILTNAALAPAIARLLPALPDENLLIEPMPAGTGPALAWAAREIARRDGDAAVMISVHADWTVGEPDRFRATLAAAADAAERHRALVTVGIVPTRPDPGFGYLQPGAPVEGARRLARFVEKPTVAVAEEFIAQGFLWNSGIFVWRVGDLRREIEAHTPEIAPALASAATAAEFFGAVTPISIDHGVMERSAGALVLDGDFAWDDVGTWAALRRVRTADDAGNAVAGEVYAVASSGNVAHAEAGTVVLYGVSDLVVVAREGLTLVTTLERAADLKTLLDALPPAVRDRA